MFKHSDLVTGRGLTMFFFTINEYNQCPSTNSLFMTYAIMHVCLNVCMCQGIYAAPLETSFAVKCSREIIRMHFIIVIIIMQSGASISPYANDACCIVPLFPPNENVA